MFFHTTIFVELLKRTYALYLNYYFKTITLRSVCFHDTNKKTYNTETKGAQNKHTKRIGSFQHINQIVPQSFEHTKLKVHINHDYKQIADL